MNLTDEQRALVRGSLDAAGREHPPDSTFFYERLFAKAPGLREMFRDDLAGQGMKFMSTLRLIVATLDDPKALTEDLAELGDLHATLGVQPAHFLPLKEALIETFGEILGAAFTDAHALAWRDAYDQIAQAMIASIHQGKA